MNKLISAIAGIFTLPSLRDRLPERQHIELEISRSRLGVGL